MASRWEFGWQGQANAVGRHAPITGLQTCRRPSEGAQVTPLLRIVLLAGPWHALDARRWFQTPSKRRLPAFACSVLSKRWRCRHASGKRSNGPLPDPRHSFSIQITRLAMPIYCGSSPCKRHGFKSIGAGWGCTPVLQAAAAGLRCDLAPGESAPLPAFGKKLRWCPSRLPHLVIEAWSNMPGAVVALPDHASCAPNRSRMRQPMILARVW